MQNLIQSRILPIFILFIAVFLPSTAVAQDTRSETSFAEVKQESRDLVRAMKNYSSDQRDDAVDAATQALFKLDNRIRDLEYRIDNRWNDMTDSARDRARESLRALQQQRVEIAEWYGGLKSDSGDAWDDLKQGFAKAYGEINRGWENALREFEADRDSQSAS